MQAYSCLTGNGRRALPTRMALPYAGLLQPCGQMLRLAVAIFFILHSAFFISCSDDLSLSDDSAADAVVATAGGRLRITADEGTSATRTTISGVTTTFDDGDIVGCVICTKDASGNYQYLCTSKWKYSSTYRTFLIERYWTTTAPTSSEAHTRADEESSSTTLYAYEPIEGDIENFLISYETDSSDPADSSDDTDVGSGYTLISDDAGTLYLFFYRPYNDPLESVEDRPFLSYWPKVTVDGTTSYLMGFAGPSADCTFSTTVAKADDSGSYTTTTGTLNDSVKCFSWEEYPIFIHLDQSLQASGETAYGLEMSDGLSAQYLNGISSETNETLRLSFNKQAATVRVMASETLTEAYLINGKDSTIVTQDDGKYVVWSDHPIIAGSLVSIKETSDVNFTDAHSLYQYSRIQGSDQIAGCVYTPSFDYTVPSGAVSITSAARFHLPPQEDFNARLLYKTSSSDTYQYLDVSALGNSTLEAGMRYTVNLFSIDDQYLYVSSTSAYKTNGAYLTLGREDSGTLSYTSSSTTYTFGSTTISYYFKMSNGNGEYLGIYAPTTMTLTVYLVNETSTPSAVIFETDEEYSGTTLYSSPSFTSVTDDSGNTVLKATVQLTEGFYRMRRSGGTCNLIYATLTM